MPTARPFYEEFGWAYDLLVNDPVEPWTLAVQDALRAGGIAAPAHVLDAGCGTGRHAEALAAAGHELTLVDSAQPLLHQAEKRLPSARVACEDLRRLDLGTRFDVVVCRGVLNDLLQAGERQAVLAALARHLGRGGLLILDVREAGQTAKRYRKGRMIRRSVPLPEGTLEYVSHGRVDGPVVRFRERHRLNQTVAEHEFAMRPWTADELRFRLATAGFGYADVCPGRAGRPEDRLFCQARLVYSRAT
jgi:SAM-dependent methyltransferase